MTVPHTQCHVLLYSVQWCAVLYTYTVLCSVDGLGRPDLHFSLLQGLELLPGVPPNPSRATPAPPLVAAVQAAGAAVFVVPPGPLLLLCTAAIGPAVIVPVTCRELTVDVVPETVPGISTVVGGSQLVVVLL